MPKELDRAPPLTVALRKESVDRNSPGTNTILFIIVALRKESVDRNGRYFVAYSWFFAVALRKESVDRNNICVYHTTKNTQSLSARRAWIEIPDGSSGRQEDKVALRKESVDRNAEILQVCPMMSGRSPQGERG